MDKEETEKPAEEITAETKEEHFTSVESSAFTGFHYDAEANTIEIKFPDGDVYKYGDAENPYTAELHEKFLAAKSKGSFLNNHIKKLPFTDLTVRTATVEKPEEEENASIEPANGVFNGDGQASLGTAEVVTKDDLLKEAEEEYLAEKQRIVDGAMAKYDEALTAKVTPEEKLEFTEDGYAKYPDYDKVHSLDFLNDKAAKMIQLYDEERANGASFKAESKAQIGTCELEPGVVQRYVVILRPDGVHSKELI